MNALHGASADRGRTLLTAALAAMAMALGVACGDSDDDDPPASASSTKAESPREAGKDSVSGGGDATDDKSRDPATGRRDSGAGDPRTPPSNADGDKRQVAEVVRGMYRSFAAGDAAAVCAAMSKDARGQIARQPPGPGTTSSAAGGSCAGSLSKFLDAAAQSGILERTLMASVGDVTVNGRNATALVSLSGREGPVHLVKESGEWRFGAPPTAPK